MQKAPQGNRLLARHQLNAPRQRNHLQLLARAQAKLLTHPLGDDDLVLGGNGCEIHEATVAQACDLSENSTQLDGGYGYHGAASGMSRRAHQRPELDQLEPPNRGNSKFYSVEFAVFEQEGNQLSELPGIFWGGIELVLELNKSASILELSALSRAISLSSCCIRCSCAIFRCSYSHSLPSNSISLSSLSTTGRQLSVANKRRNQGSEE
jgi:hypothetical protein